MLTFDHTVEVLRNTSESPVCDRCGSAAFVCADTATGPLLMCPEAFVKHAFALVQRQIPLTLIRGLSL